MRRVCKRGRVTRESTRPHAFSHVPLASTAAVACDYQHSLQTDKHVHLRSRIQQYLPKAWLVPPNDRSTGVHPSCSQDCIYEFAVPQTLVVIRSNPPCLFVYSRAKKGIGFGLWFCGTASTLSTQWLVRRGQRISPCARRAQGDPEEPSVGATSLLSPEPP
jgi:hypothetical protein